MRYWLKISLDQSHHLVKQCLCIITAIFCIHTSTGFAEHGPKTWSASYQSVVTINPTWPGYGRPGFGAPPGTAPAGSGIYFSENQENTGFVLTAAHVVTRASNIEIVNAAGERADAIIHAVDNRRDLAVLKTSLRGPAMNLGNDDIPVGTHVCVIGNSFGLGNSMSCGVVSALNRRNIGFNGIEDFIQTDAAVNPGGSGGALIDGEGRLIGLVDGIFTKDADIDAGVNFAISLSLIRDGLTEMRAAGVLFSE